MLKCIFFSKITLYFLPKLSNVRDLHRKKVYTVLGFRTCMNIRDFE